MRTLYVVLVLACSSDDAEKKMACGEARECRPDDQGCATFPYEQLPDRCQDICYSHQCCSENESGWHLVIYDCARPADAGVDAP